MVWFGKCANFTTACVDLMVGPHGEAEACQVVLYVSTLCPPLLAEKPTNLENPLL